MRRAPAQDRRRRRADSARWWEREEILRKADIALYRAKSEPDSAVCFFEEEMDRHVRERDSIERDLAAAIGTDALRPRYQPIIDLKSGTVVQFEALARWSHPVHGDVPPDRSSRSPRTAA